VPVVERTNGKWRHTDVRADGTLLQDDWSVHHSKMLVLFSPLRIRIVVSTANFVSTDWESVTNGVRLITHVMFISYNHYLPLAFTLCSIALTPVNNYSAFVFSFATQRSLFSF
jgi:hypothetical protein